MILYVMFNLYHSMINQMLPVDDEYLKIHFPFETIIRIFLAVNAFFMHGLMHAVIN